MEVFRKSLCAKWNEWMRMNWNVMSVRYFTVFGRKSIPNFALFLLFVGCFFFFDNHKIHIVRIILSLNIYASISSTNTQKHRQRYHKKLNEKLNKYMEWMSGNVDYTRFQIRNWYNYLNLIYIRRFRVTCCLRSLSM